MKTCGYIFGTPCGIESNVFWDTLYIELKRPDIISKIKDLQYNLMKVSKTSADDTIVAHARNM